MIQAICRIERKTLPTPEPVSRETKHWVCFPCRKMFRKQPTTTSALCPQCALAMIDMGRKFAPPPMSAMKLWNRLERLAAKGYRFHSTIMQKMIFGQLGVSGMPNARTAVLRVDAVLEQGAFHLLQKMMGANRKVPRNRGRKMLITEKAW